jgi:methyl-accepting chemotaxis protein
MKFPWLDRAYADRPIKITLVVWFLLFSLGPLGLAGYFAYSKASNALKQSVAEKMSRITTSNLDKIDRTLFERFGEIQVWSTLELTKMAIEVGSGVGGASDFVNDLIQKYPVYTLMMLLDLQGRCVTINTVNSNNIPLPTEALFLGANFSKAPWFRDALTPLQNSPVVITDWQYVEVLEKLSTQMGQKPEAAYSIVFSILIRNAQGVPIGVWANFIDWDTIQNMLDQIQNEIPKMPPTTVSFLLKADNDTIIAHSGVAAQNGGSLYGKRLTTDLRQPQLADHLSTAGSVFTYSWDGKLKTVASAREKGYRKYSGKFWRYVLIADDNTVYAQVRSLRANILFIGVISTPLIILLAYFIGDRIAAPLMLLSARAEAVARGDLSPRATLELQGASVNRFRNEALLLVRSFNQMTANLQHLIRQIKGASSRVQTSSNKISAALERLTEVSEQQSQAIVQTTSRVEEVAAASGEIASGAVIVAEFAENTERAAGQGVRAAIQTLARIQEIKQANDQNRHSMSALNTCSQEISKIVEVITNIADNTELIAFNAALEAAGAGMAGNRFGAVAGEMRRLANTVATEVKSIERKISEIQRGISSLVKSFEMETQKIDTGVQDMHITMHSLEMILEKIEQTTFSIMQISEATTEQQTANEHIVGVLQQMSKETVQFQEIATQTLTITMELNRLAEELLQTVDVFQVGI